MTTNNQIEEENRSAQPKSVFYYYPNQIKSKHSAFITTMNATDSKQGLAFLTCDREETYLAKKENALINAWLQRFDKMPSLRQALHSNRKDVLLNTLSKFLICFDEKDQPESLKVLSKYLQEFSNSKETNLFAFSRVRYQNRLGLSFTDGVDGEPKKVRMR